MGSSLGLECFTSPTCATPTSTSLNWQIYRSYRWTAILEPKMKCERPAGEAPEAADLAACQEKAEAEGRELVVVVVVIEERVTQKSKHR